MKKQIEGLSNAAILRQKAEEQLKKQQSKTRSLSSETDLLKLIHELEVHQIELEMQNIELVAAKEKAIIAEEKYTELYDFAPSGYLSLTKEGRITELNFAAAKMFGKERSQIIKSKFELFLSDNTRSVFSLFLDMVFTSKTKQTCEVTIATKSKLPLYANIEGVVSQNDEFCIITMVDITKIRLTEIHLKDAKQHAEESDHLKSAFLANMSHEIRTPMNGILGFSELLKDPKLEGETQQEYISIIEKSGKRMLNIINEIIDISKIESGQMQVFISEVDLNKLLEECYRFFKPEAEKKNIELKLFKALQFENVKLKTDSDKLNGILTNLVKNAIKYTKVGSIELGYSLNDLKTEIEFYVKDTGIGIPKDRQAAIFERFIQADIEDKMAQQGAGLGLAIVRAYVEMLKGRIWVESEVNVGSTIYFTLPYKILGMTEIVSPINEEKNKQIKNLKILIVEDDEASNQLLSITVNKFALKIISAINGKEAIKACQNNPDIDLVLMDIQLPEMNGYEATKQIREFNKEVIIIAQTAFAFSGDREKSIAAGCNDYISKPIKKLELEILIQKHINKS
jgi:PAS domain S-box-containing protein